MKSPAKTPDQYLADLPEDRREFVAQLRHTVNEHIPDGFEETMQYGMISWVVPLERYPDTYNGQPLAVASIANQKRHVSLYLMGVYAQGDEGADEIEAAFDAAGKKLDMGKACVRFRRVEDVPFEVVADAIGSVSVDEFIAMTEAAYKR